MSQRGFLRFLTAARDDPALLARYNRRDLGQLIFHAHNEGFDFAADDVAAVAGDLENGVIVGKDHEQVGATSRLWREMWGEPHLEYLVRHVLSRYSPDELTAWNTR